MNDVLKLQEVLLDCEQVDIETTHRFANGIYSREIIIPKGVALVGAKHLTEHSFVISKGSCVVNDGKGKKQLSAPYHGITSPGTKRSIYAIEDTVFATFHVTSKTSVHEIEKEIIDPEINKIANNGGRLLK